MKIETFLEESGLSHTEAADKFGCTRMALHRYINGRIPQPHIMVKIYKATAGKVAPNDFYALPKPRKAKVSK